jgi:hypothetical protein
LIFASTQLRSPCSHQLKDRCLIIDVLIVQPDVEVDVHPVAGRIRAEGEPLRASHHVPDNHRLRADLLALRHDLSTLRRSCQSLVNGFLNCPPSLIRPSYEFAR